MIRHQPISNLTHTLLPYPTPSLSHEDLLDPRLPRGRRGRLHARRRRPPEPHPAGGVAPRPAPRGRARRGAARPLQQARSEEHTSELQSLMRNSYAVFCLKKKKHMSIRNEGTKIRTKFTK